MSLWSIRQENGQFVRKYLARFTEESNKVDRFGDRDVTTAIIEGLRTTDFLKFVVDRISTRRTELIA